MGLPGRHHGQGGRPGGGVDLEGSDTIQQINAMVVGMNGKQLKYKDLVV